MTSDTDLIENLHDRVCEGSVILQVETNRTGDPERYRVGIRALGEDEHKEYVASDFRAVLEDSLQGHDEFLTENQLELWGELAEPPTEEVETLIACLGDDAAQLREENDEDERAATMDDAAAMLARLERANRQLFELGQKMYAKLQATQPAAKLDRFLGMVRVWVEREGGDMDAALAWMYAGPAVLGYVSDDGLFGKTIGTVPGGPPRTWMPVRASLGATPAAPAEVTDDELISALDSDGIACDPELAFTIRDIVQRLLSPSLREQQEGTSK